MSPARAAVTPCLCTVMRSYLPRSGAPTRPRVPPDITARVSPRALPKLRPGTAEALPDITAQAPPMTPTHQLCPARADDPVPSRPTLSSPYQLRLARVDDPVPSRLVLSSPRRLHPVHVELA